MNDDVVARHCLLNICGGSGKVLLREMANMHDKFCSNSKTSSSLFVNNGLCVCTWWDSDRVALLIVSMGGDVVSVKRTCGCAHDMASMERTCRCAHGGMAARQGPLCVYGDMVARCHCGLKESTRWQR